jgi:cell wall-associated NlpC family hydrolase
MFIKAGNRLAVDFTEFNLSISKDEALKILQQNNITPIEVDIIEIARSHIGKPFRIDARFSEAPEVFNCSNLIKWLYAQLGIWLPKRAITQAHFPLVREIQTNEIQTGDLIYLSGFRNLYFDNPNDGIGHVVFCSGQNTVFHAPNRTRTVIEEPLSDILAKKEKFRKCVRVFSHLDNIITLNLPPDSEIENSEDIRWLLMSKKVERTE